MLSAHLIDEKTETLDTKSLTRSQRATEEQSRDPASASLAPKPQQTFPIMAHTVCLLLMVLFVFSRGLYIDLFPS